MLKGLFTLLAQPGNAIIAGAGIFSTVVTVGVVTSGAEIVVEERAEAIVTQLNKDLIAKHNKEIENLQASNSQLATKLANSTAATDPRNCDQNPTSQICVFILRALAAQKQELDEKHRLARLAYENEAQQALRAELAALSNTLNQQCQTKLSDQATQSNTECDRKLAAQEARLKRDLELSQQRSLRELAAKHKAELAAQKRELTDLCATRLRAQSERTKSEISDLKSGHARAIKAFEVEIDRLKKLKECRIQ